MSRSFVRGAFILMLAAGINRIIGFIYQAIIFRMVGPEGIGLFNLVYPVYILILVIATAGIPLGISKLVSEEEALGNRQKSFQILWLCLTILMISGSLLTVTAFFLSPLLARHVFVNKMVFPVFLTLLPGILVISISSAFRGFFQGLMNMKPPALGQVVEQIVRVAVGIAAATWLLPYGIQWAAAGIAGAGVAGEFFGLGTLLIIFWHQKPSFIHFSLPGFSVSVNILRKLAGLCAPITVGRAAAAILLSVDSFLIPLLLKKSGLSTEAATAFFGQLTGVAAALLYLPSVITVSLATSLVPAISEAVALKRKLTVAGRTSEAIRITLLAGLPFVTAYLVMPGELTEVIYASPASGPILQILAFGGLFAYLQQTTTGILQGFGNPALPLRNMLAGAVCKLFLLVTLTPLPGFGIKGTAWSFVGFYGVAAFLNLVSLQKKNRFTIRVSHVLVKPVLAAGATGIIFNQCLAAVYAVSASLAFSTVVSLFTGFGAYFLALFAMGALTRQDLSRVPLFRNFF